MYQFFVESGQIGKDSVMIEGSDVNHIKNVLRMKPGEKIRISGPAGENYFCEIAESCLSAAGLPGFYPPHLMEQATLLSIACAYSRGNEPEVVYGKIRAAI